MAQKEALPTQQFIELKEIKDGVLVLKTGALRRILMVSGINFDLKSEEERNLIIFSYQNFLNSLNFSFQTFIHSRRLNIDDYLERVKKIEEIEPNELLKNQISEYYEFVKNLVGQNPIMAKTFFVIIPYDPVVIPKAGGGLVEKISDIFGKKKPDETAEKAKKEEKFSQHLLQLSQRADQVISGLNSIGLRAVPLNTEEVIELFYNLYNPAAMEKRKLAIAQE
jgi:type IV secretory pathway VirB4 component